MLCISGIMPSIVHICEHEHLYIRCHDDGILNVYHADYGRTDNTTCPAAAGLIQNTDCRGSVVVGQVRSACDDQHECYLEANNAVFGDPCVGTYKYLMVSYSCNVQ
jgi:C-type mannose receptor